MTWYSRPCTRFLSKARLERQTEGDREEQEAFGRESRTDLHLKATVSALKDQCVKMDLENNAPDH